MTANTNPEPFSRQKCHVPVILFLKLDVFWHRVTNV